MTINGAVRTTARNRIELIAMGTLVALSYWFVFASLVHQWVDDPNYTHGLFVIPMAGVLAWRRRDRWKSTPATPSLWGLAAIAAGGSLYIVGVAAAELFTMRVSMVVSVSGLVLLTQGWPRTRLMVFPLAFLLFMVPVPYIFYYKLTFPLQLLSSRLAAGVLSAMGMPIVLSGNVIHLEHYVLEVVTACSGLRSIMTLGAMGVFLVDLFRLRAVLKWVLIAMVIPVAILANTVRLVTTAVVSAIAGAEAADSFLHELSGVLVFLTGLMILIAVGKLMEWVDKR